jgi:hypothetical protein
VSRDSAQHAQHSSAATDDDDGAGVSACAHLRATQAAADA